MTLAIIATQLATLEFWESVLATGIRVALPLGLAALGELIGERAGVLNLGVEGTMALGAIGGVTAAVIGGPTLGLVGGLLVGALVGLVFALTVVHARINEIVVGFALALGGVALATFLYRAGFDARPQIRPFGAVAIPVLSDLPVVGRPVFRQPLIIWLLPVVAGLTAWVLHRTRIGLTLRAVGDGPEAARARGIDVERVRTAALVVGGALGGLAGAVLAAGLVGEFSDQIIGGRGFVALALVIAAGWRPWVLVPLVLAVGSLQGFQLRVQAIGGIGVPVPVLQSLPYLVTLAVLALGIGAVRAPRTLGKAATT